MKKISLILLSLVVALSVTFGLVACGDDYTGTVEGLDPKIELQIKKAYAKKQGCKASGVTIQEYCGEYNDAYAVLLTAASLGYPAVITSETVAEVTFVYHEGNKIQVYFGGEFYYLQEAYDNELLTQADLICIAEKHYEYDPSLKDYQYY